MIVAILLRIPQALAIRHEADAVLHCPKPNKLIAQDPGNRNALNQLAACLILMDVFS